MADARYAMDEYMRVNKLAPRATSGFAYDLNQSFKSYELAGAGMGLNLPSKLVAPDIKEADMYLEKAIAEE